jgi:glutamine amidotransferase
MITIVDYGVGNVGSIRNMLKHIGVPCEIGSSPSHIANARALVLAGVGAFDAAMRELRKRGLADPIDDAVASREIPVLGICLGMQIATRGSEEGASEPGFGWIQADTVRFRPPTNVSIRIPHMGWNDILVRRPDDIVEGLSDARFYFVHSYHVACDDESDVVAEAVHGRAFPAIIRRKNVFGTQFHPEKSHRFGMTLLRNFARTIDEC